MDCNDEIGSIIVTIAIITHGTVIDAELSLDRQLIFENTRLFSQSGDFTVVAANELMREGVLGSLNKRFQKDLNVPSVEVIEDYANVLRPKYQKYIGEEKNTNPLSCRIFQNITVDKAVGKSSIRSTFFKQMINCIIPQLNGIFIVSIHRKEATDRFTLIYPLASNSKIDNLNLLKISNLQLLADFFQTRLPNLREESLQHTFPNLENDIPLEQAAEQLNLWNLSFSNPDTIDYIRMSFLVKMVKDIIGSRQCKINLLDYSCSALNKRFSQSQTSNLKYWSASDVENPGEKGWGGKRRRRRRRRVITPSRIDYVVNAQSASPRSAPEESVLNVQRCKRTIITRKGKKNKRKYKTKKHRGGG